MYGFIDLLLRTPVLLVFKAAFILGQTWNERLLRQAAFVKSTFHITLDQYASASSRVLSVI
jgi:hypothetical protein